MYNSSAFQGGVPPGTSLGYAEASDIFTSFPATFAGQPILDNTAVQGNFSYANAVNLSGFKLASNFGRTYVANFAGPQAGFDTSDRLEDLI